jgi:hypothetical protein
MDRTTKILLAAIALGLWANAAATMVRPAIAQISSTDFSIMASRLSHIEDLVNRIRICACH